MPDPLLSKSFASPPVGRFQMVPGAFFVAGCEPPETQPRMAFDAVLNHEKPPAAGSVARPCGPIAPAGCSGSMPVRTICGSPLYRAFR